MKKTLLEIVQSTLSAMDSDAVSEIGESIESEQVVTVAQDTFLELCTYQNIPQYEKLTQLLGLNDNTRATVMRIPENSTHIRDIRYKVIQSDNTTCMEKVEYLKKDDFLERQLRLKVGADNVGENVLEGNIRVPYYTDRAPQCYTTFDDEHLIFDALQDDGTGTTTMNNDDSLLLAYIVPEFKLENDYVPELPLALFPQYMNMIKELCINEQKQIASPLRTRNGEREQHRNRHFSGITEGSDQGFKEGYEQRAYGRFSRNQRTASRRGGTGLPIIRS